MSLDALMLKLKGGSTSGNFGHSGRPGKKGGSTPGGGHSAIGITNLGEKKRIIDDRRQGKKAPPGNDLKSKAQDVINKIGSLYDNIKIPKGATIEKGAEKATKKCLGEEGFCHNNALDYVKNNPNSTLMAGVFIGGPDIDGGINNLGLHSWVKENGKNIDPTLGKSDKIYVGFEVPRDKALQIKSDSHLEAALNEIFTDNKYEHPEIDATISLIR